MQTGESGKWSRRGRYFGKSRRSQSAVRSQRCTWVGNHRYHRSHCYCSFDSEYIRNLHRLLHRNPHLRSVLEILLQFVCAIRTMGAAQNLVITVHVRHGRLFFQLNAREMRDILIIGLIIAVVVILIRVAMGAPMLRRVMESFTGSTVNTVTVCPSGSKFYMYDGGAFCCSGKIKTEANSLQESCSQAVSTGQLTFCGLGPSRPEAKNCSQIQKNSAV